MDLMKGLNNMNNQKYCPNCGAEINVNDYTCSNCGTSIRGLNENKNQNSASNLFSRIVDAGNSLFSQYMFREEEWWLVMLLSIVTAGGYGIYYWYRQMIEVKTIEMHQQVENKFPFLLFLLLYYASATIAGFVFVVIYYQRLVAVAKEAFDIDLKPGNAYVYAILMYVPVYSWYLSVKNHNKVIALYNDSINHSQGAQRQTVNQFYNTQSKSTNSQQKQYANQNILTNDIVTQKIDAPSSTSERIIQQSDTHQKPIYNHVNEFNVYPNDESILDAANAGLDDI